VTIFIIVIPGRGLAREPGIQPRQHADGLLRLPFGKSGARYALCRRHERSRASYLLAQEKTAPGFTSRYGVDRLVWFEQHDDVSSAILREKEIKKWRRAWKIRLIEEGNSAWRDLYFDIVV
jgi:predicted GIY-YIG superfamily endonuclease